MASKRAFLKLDHAYFSATPARIEWLFIGRPARWIRIFFHSGHGSYHSPAWDADLSPYIYFYHWLTSLRSPTGEAPSWDTLTTGQKIAAIEHNAYFVAQLGFQPPFYASIRHRKMLAFASDDMNYAAPLESRDIGLLAKYGAAKLTRRYLETTKEPPEAIMSHLYCNWFFRYMLPAIPNRALYAFIFVFGTAKLCRAYLRMPGAEKIADRHDYSPELKLFWARYRRREGLPLAVTNSFDAFLDGAPPLRSVMMVLRGLDVDSFAWSLQALIDMVRLGFFAPKAGDSIALFLNLVSDMPLDLQMRICKLAYAEDTGDLGHNITAEQIRCGFQVWEHIGAE